MTRHRWSNPTRFDHKTERECQNGCNIVRVTVREPAGAFDRHRTEFWRGLDKIECKGTPPCTGRAKAATAYEAGSYPL